MTVTNRSLILSLRKGNSGFTQITSATAENLETDMERAEFPLISLGQGFHSSIWICLLKVFHCFQTFQ